MPWDGTESSLLTELRGTLWVPESAVMIEVFLVWLLCVAVRLHSVDKTFERLRGEAYKISIKGNMQLFFSLVNNVAVPEFSANRKLPQQRYILHCLRTFSFRAQWKTKIKKPERE